MTSAVSHPYEGPDTELRVAADMVKLSLVITPLLITICGLIWGVSGATSSAYAIALAVANLFAGAAFITLGARISPSAVMVGAFVGFGARMALVLFAVLMVIESSWVEPVALGVSLIVTHLGLLAWEATRVSASLAFPGLKPTPTRK